jgi:hypothetical protein
MKVMNTKLKDGKVQLGELTGKEAYSPAAAAAAAACISICTVLHCM